MGVNIIQYSGVVLIDLSGLTVTPETLAEGVTAIDAAGELIVGTAKLYADNRARTTLSVARSCSAVVGEAIVGEAIVGYTPGGVNKIIFCNRVIFDTTATTVTPETLAEGVTAIDAAGRTITGVARLCSAVVGEAIVGEAIVGYAPAE